MNPMEKAWALLKANPDMTDSKGRTVPPAAMNYAQQARALEDSLEYNNPIGGLEERYNVDVHQDMRDKEATSDFREALKNPKFAQRKVGGETMQEHHDFARDRSKRDTSEYMGHEHPLGEEYGYFGPDVLIERQPRPEETDVANIMDEDIRRLNPKMKNIGHSSGRV